ncbi:DegT/DnrJ/EryC1/StrS family aminotransferase [Candidatus Saccharibacteria bacterium]|nr:DegT/DnrJ/EryC1/StrS family aminotransferase [Candidatus Saccharibacteria bacterium]
MSSRLFLGQASNYKSKDVLKHTFAFGSRKCANKLRYEIAKRYTTLESLVHLMNNGRSALAAGLKLTIPEGSEVIINAFTCYAVVQAVEYAGMKPVYADIDEKTLSFTAETLEDALKDHKNVKAIILQNTLGIPMDIKAIEKVAEENKLVMIEDLAHCTGMKYVDGREIGSVGAVAALSFGKGKSLDSITGGALVINDRHLKIMKSVKKHPKLSDTLRARWYPVLASVGRSLSRIHLEKYWYGPLIKIHFIERAVDAKLDLKRRPAYWQDKLILKQLEKIPEKGAKPIRTHKFVKNRAELIEKLARNGFNFREIWYDVPISPVRYYKDMNFPEKEFPVATKVAKKIINLPTYYKAEDLKPALEIIKEYEND